METLDFKALAASHESKQPTIRMSHKYHDLNPNSPTQNFMVVRSILSPADKMQWHGIQLLLLWSPWWCREYTLQPNPWSSTIPIPLSYSDCCFISLEFPLDRKSKDSNIPELNFWQFLFAAWLQAIYWSLKRYCRPRWGVAQSWSTWRGDRIAQALPKGLSAVAKTGIRSLNTWIPIAMAVSSPWLWYKLPSMTLSCKTSPLQCSRMLLLCV